MAISCRSKRGGFNLIHISDIFRFLVDLGRLKGNQWGSHTLQRFRLVAFETPKTPLVRPRSVWSPPEAVSMERRKCKGRSRMWFRYLRWSCGGMVWGQDSGNHKWLFFGVTGPTGFPQFWGLRPTCQSSHCPYLTPMVHTTLDVLVAIFIAMFRTSTFAR